MRGLFVAASACAVLVSAAGKAKPGEVVDENGTRIKKKYELKTGRNSMDLKAEYSEDLKGKGGRSKEKLTWKFEGNGEGFKLDNKYYASDADAKTKTGLRMVTSAVVEFEKNDPADEDEVYSNQTVVTEYKLNQWNDVVFDGACTVDTNCTATFADKSNCLTVVVRANLADGVADGRIQLNPDDIKLDYKFGDGCPVTTDNHALALIGKVSMDTKTNDKPSKAEKVEADLDGLVSEESEGTSAYLTWLGEIDCGADLQTHRKVKVHKEVETNGKNTNMKWTVHKKAGDTNCVWDPVQGVAVAGMTSAAASTTVSAALAAGLMAMLVVM